MMMNSSITERIKVLKEDGYKIAKLMAYEENDYERIMELIKTTWSEHATFTSESEPAALHEGWAKILTVGLQSERGHG